MPRLLILGMARSGTLYTTKVLRALGKDVIHETHPGSDGLVSWHPVFDGHPPPRPDLITEVKHKDFDVLLHQVRHPLKTIGSSMALAQQSRSHAERVLGIRWGKNDIRGATECWIKWNREAERVAQFTYKVEDMAEVLPKILSAVGWDTVEALGRVGGALNTVSTKTHHWSRSKVVSIEHIPEEFREDLQQMALHYGYGRLL